MLCGPAQEFLKGHLLTGRKTSLNDEIYKMTQIWFQTLNRIPFKQSRLLLGLYKKINNTQQYSRKTTPLPHWCGTPTPSAPVYCGPDEVNDLAENRCAWLLQLQPSINQILISKPQALWARQPIILISLHGERKYDRMALCHMLGVTWHTTATMRRSYPVRMIGVPSINQPFRGAAIGPSPQAVNHRMYKALLSNMSWLHAPVETHG